MEVISFNPIDASESIIDSVERYLRSTFNPRREVIASEYLKALEISRNTNELGGSLFRQIRRSFASGASLQELYSEGLIHEHLLNFMDNAPYVHQSKALQLTSKKRNVVIATGTGSGKTESFLMPIVDSLLKESDAGELSPGIRAIIVYPMNALAADQLGRFREVMVKYPEITFGRFVGPTKQTNTEAVRENGEKLFQANERPSRDEILENPPHILITNYAMLERLMLLPKWQQMFTHKLKWIVMDEVHSYDGTKGIEISLLLRRLKVRTASSEGVQCIAASATLGNGSKEDILRTCKFASILFGEKFEEGDIILPEYSSKVAEEPLVDIFSIEERQNLEKYRHEEVGTYHLFVKNPGGAFICLSGDHFKDAPRMRLQQRKWCPECDGVSRMVEIGACRSCGIEYLIAKNTNGELMPVDEFDEAARYYRIISAQLPDWPVDQREIRNVILDDDDEDSNHEVETVSQSLWFCPNCSKLNTSNKCTKCSKQLLVEVSEELSLSRNGKLCCNRCQSSGGRSAFGAVIRPVSGVDALTSVISTALYEHLPTNDKGGAIRGGRRKLLAFSDNRQDAAYFAPYLEDSYFDFLRRRVIHEAAKTRKFRDSVSAVYDERFCGNNAKIL